MFWSIDLQSTLGSADPAGTPLSAPRPATPPSPPIVEPDPANMSRIQAIIMTQGLDQDFLRSISAAFLFRQTRPLILEGLDAGLLASTELRRLVVASEARNLRVSTMVQIILRAMQS